MNARSRHPLPLSGLVPLALILAPAAAGAATGDQLEEVIITAEHRAEDLQKAPVSVQVISGEEISTMGRTKLDDVLQNTPAVIVQGAARGFLVSIRGQGDNLPPQNGETSVSTNFDGMYSFRAESGSIGFYDLDHVEVLSGPQNTLYGRSASGGVVNINSRDPKLGETNGYGTVEMGSYSLLRTEGAVNLPVSDSVAVRAAYANINRDGYLSNGHDDAVGSGARVKLLYKPADDFQLLLGTEFTKLGGQGPGAVPIGTYLARPHYTTDSNAGFQKYSGWKYWALATWQVGPGTLTVQPSYQTGSGQTFGAYGGNYSNSADPKLAKQTAAEVRYASRADARWQWDVGFYHYNNENQTAAISGACQDPSGVVLVPLDGYSYAGFGPPGTPCVTTPYQIDTRATDAKTATDAFFGQVTAPVSDTFRLIAGLRSTHDHKSSDAPDPSQPNTALTRPIVSSEVSYNHVDWRVGAQLDAGARSMVYLTAASGYRPGGFNFNNQPFDSEKLVAYELGTKNRFADNRLQVNANVYYYHYTSYQLTDFGFNPNTNTFNVWFSTLPGARNTGGEVDLRWLATADDSFNLSFNYLDAKITSNNPLTTNPWAGAPFPQSPKTTLKGGYSHTFRLASGATLAPRIDVRSLSSQFVAPVNATQALATSDAYQAAYTTGDVSANFAAASGKWELNAYVKNVNNQIVKNADFFGWVNLQAPRTVGLVLTGRL